MKHISKIAALAVAGALAAVALTGCSGTDIRNNVVGTYEAIHDGVVGGWNDMVDHFEADAPLYGVEAPSSGSQSAQ